MPIRVTQIITSLRHPAGAEQALVRLLERVDRRRFDIDVIALQEGGEMADRVAALGFDCHCLPLAGTIAPLSIGRLLTHLRRRRPAVVQTWMYHANLVGGLVARLAGAPAVAWNLRNSGVNRRVHSGSVLWASRLSAALSRVVPEVIVSCSAAALVNHRALGYSDRWMVHIPNGYELAEFPPASVHRRAVRAEFGLAADAPVAGVVARFHPEKNHRGFAAAAGQVARRLPEARFVLCGQGVEETNRTLTDWLEAAGVRDRCLLLGPRTDVPRLMAALDILVLPSHGEAFPNVVAEAMCVGVPAVVTDVGDAAAIVGATGRVAPPGDPARLAAAMVALLNRPEECREMGRRARRRAARLFALEATVRRYEELWARLAER